MTQILKCLLCWLNLTCLQKACILVTTFKPQGREQKRGREEREDPGRALTNLIAEFQVKFEELIKLVSQILSSFTCFDSSTFISGRFTFNCPQIGFKSLTFKTPVID